jgi:hypothetical protein
MSRADPRSVPELFADGLNQFSKLVRNEIHLARTELSIKAGQFGTAAGLLGVAALFIIPTLVLFLVALAHWLVEFGLRPSLAHLLAGIVGLSIAAVLGLMGLNRLKATSLVPKRTLHQLQQDATAAREHI